MSDDEPTIAELCAPLSARVMPERLKHTLSGRNSEDPDERRMLAAQRAEQSMRARKHVIKRKKRKDTDG